MIDAEKLETYLRDAEAAHKEYETKTGVRDENWPKFYAEFIAKKLNEPPVFPEYPYVPRVDDFMWGCS